MGIYETLEQRAFGIQRWLKDHYPQVSEEQKHLDDGTIERQYWHYGYYIAINDVLRLLARNN